MRHLARRPAARRKVLSQTRWWTGLFLIIMFGLVLSPTLPSVAGPVMKVTLVTEPQAPVDRDDAALLLTVHDANDLPVNNAQVRVYFMRDASGHVHTDHNTAMANTSWSAPVDAIQTSEPGVYRAINSFSQSGKWFVRVTVETAAGLSESAFVLRVQASSGTGETNLGWIELSVVGLALLVAIMVTFVFGEERRRILASALSDR